MRPEDGSDRKFQIQPVTSLTQDENSVTFWKALKGGENKVVLSPKEIENHNIASKR